MVNKVTKKKAPKNFDSYKFEPKELESPKVDSPLDAEIQESARLTRAKRKNSTLSLINNDSIQNTHSLEEKPGFFSQVRQVFKSIAVRGPLCWILAIILFLIVLLLLIVLFIYLLDYKGVPSFDILKVVPDPKLSQPVQVKLGDGSKANVKK